MIAGMRVKLKMLLLLVVTIVGMVVVGSYALSQIKNLLIETRKAEVKNLTVSAASVMEQFRIKEEKGVLSREEAQKQAYEALRGVRFGENDYFFVYDFSGVNRMLGPKPEFEGQNKSDLKDAVGVPFVKELSEAGQRGGDFVNYLFPRAGAKEASPKLAYAAPIKAWNQFIGTGVYIDDIDIAFMKEAKAFLIFGGIILLVIGVGSLTISRSITGPLFQITHAMNDLASGNKNIEVRYTEFKNEIGDLARALETFKKQAIEVERLQAEQKAQEVRAEQERKRLMNEMANQFEQSIKGVVAGVSSAATEMQSSAHALSATAEETSRQSNAVSEAAMGASNGVQTVASAAEELNASIEEISRQAGESVSVAHSCVEEAESTSQVMVSLNKASEDIQSVVNMIDGIAHQVNLLALNATIEAARAGEAGKGFAVVANEVKNLATQTGNATKDIANQIGNIQHQTKEAVESISRISHTIRRMSEISTTVASAAEEQSAATKEIARSVQKTASDTNEVSENIGGVRQAAQETGHASSQMLDTAGQLASEAEVLRSTVDGFIAHIRES